MITFVSDSENPDHLKREGIPRPGRQLLMREQRLLDSTMSCVQAPFDAVRAGSSGESGNGVRKHVQHCISSSSISTTYERCMCACAFRHSLRQRPRRWEPR